jgi:pimeloyl-ACP methyl ester carboxylesterase
MREDRFVIPRHQLETTTMDIDSFSEVVQSTYIELPPDPNGHQNKIHIRSAGKRSTPHQPTIILICGLGSSCLSFTVVQHALATAGVPSFTHDRLGIGRSSPLLPPINTTTGTGTPPRIRPRHAEALATELDTVLRAAGVPPPYILIPHSYGGVIAWEYIAAHTENVVGLLALDANSARSCERPLNDKDFEVLAEGLPDGAFVYPDIVGLTAANRLPMSLWEEWIGKRLPPEPWLRGTGGEWAEMQSCDESCKALHRHGLIERQPLTKWPVTVLKGNTESDIRRLIDASEALGGGTRGAHEDLRRRLEGYSQLEEDQQRDFLLLTDIGGRNYVEAKKSGHWVHVTEPEVVVGEVLRMVGGVVGKEQTA